MSYHQFCEPAQIQRDFKTIIGLLEGIDSDGVINNDEINELSKWVVQAKPYEDKQPYKNLVKKISNAISDFNLSPDEKEDIIWFCSQYVNYNSYFDAITKEIQELYGVLYGIYSDNEINLKEVEFLIGWMNNREYLSGSYPFDDLKPLIKSIVESPSLENFDRLKRFCALFATPTENNNNIELVEYLNADIFDESPDIIFKDRVFCFTGESKSYTRSFFKDLIIDKGGVFTNSVTKKT